MSATLTGPYPPVLVRAGEAERLDLIGHVLLADSSATGGALTSHRVALARGADGAVPHRHDHASELFYILDGAFDLLVDEDVVTRNGRRPAGRPARNRTRVRRAPRRHRRSAGHRHSRHRTLRLLPSRRPPPRGHRTAGSLGRATGPLRHPLPRQRRLAARSRRWLTPPGSTHNRRHGRTCCRPRRVRPGPSVQEPAADPKRLDCEASGTGGSHAQIIRLCGERVW